MAELAVIGLAKTGLVVTNSLAVSGVALLVVGGGA
jgi:hypothetical protein